MTTHNDITGDLIKSKPSSKAYRDNMQRIIDAKAKRDFDEQVALEKEVIAEIVEEERAERSEGRCPHCDAVHCHDWCGTTEPRE